MKSTGIIVLAVIAVVVIAAVIISSGTQNSAGPGKYDDFARCLSSSGVKMYGAFWCSHCAAQKQAFGDGWAFVEYVECSTPDGRGQLPVCSEAGISGYPTWEFADGSRAEGELSFQELSARSGCALPE